MDYFGMKGWITVKNAFHNFLLGQVVAAQVLFSGKGITICMAPKAAIENIKNLISCIYTQKNSQDNHSLLDAYKKLNKYLTEKNFQQSVVMLVDGHSSRFDRKVLEFLRK